MTDLKQELETLEKELKELLDDWPTMSVCVNSADLDKQRLRKYSEVSKKQEMIIGIQSLIIRQLESKQ